MSIIEIMVMALWRKCGSYLSSPKISAYLYENLFYAQQKMKRLRVGTQNPLVHIKLEKEDVQSNQCICLTIFRFYWICFHSFSFLYLFSVSINALAAVGSMHLHISVFYFYFFVLSDLKLRFFS